jgi:hypothetical protein
MKSDLTFPFDKMRILMNSKKKKSFETFHSGNWAKVSRKISNSNDDLNFWQRDFLQKRKRNSSMTFSARKLSFFENLIHFTTN